MTKTLLVKLRATRLPLEQPWPVPILEYLWRAELFTLCVLGPVVVTGLLPLPGSPARLILQVVVFGVVLVTVLETARLRIFRRAAMTLLGQLRDVRRQWVDRLADGSRLPADRRSALSDLIRERIRSIDEVEEQLVRTSKHRFVPELESAKLRLGEIAATLRSASADGVFNVA